MNGPRMLGPTQMDGLYFRRGSACGEQSPGRIVSHLRLTVIAHRLASEPLSVEAAADEAGYSSAAAFVRAFQRAFGETPARWRRHRRADEPMRPAGRRPPASQRNIDARHSLRTD